MPPLSDGGSPHKLYQPNRKKTAEIDDEGWVREPGAVGWVQEGDAIGSGWSLADTDYECIHGRLRGDSCPQPATVPDANDRPKPNPDRRWDKPYPCDCWGETRVRSATPDPFSHARSHAPRATPGWGLPWVPSESSNLRPTTAAEAGTTAPAAAG